MYMNSLNNNAFMALSTLSLININLLVNTIIFLERESRQTYLYINILCARSAHARNTKNLFSKKLPVSLCFVGTFDYVDFQFKLSQFYFCASRRDASLGRKRGKPTLLHPVKDASLQDAVKEEYIVLPSDNPYRDFFCDHLNYTLYELVLINIV